jgi:bacterioferritin-associated ferredoxin
MVVCLCKNVSNRTIDTVIEDGATTIEEIGRACGAGTDCGGCHCDLEERLERAACDRSGTHHLTVVQPGAAARVA